MPRLGPYPVMLVMLLPTLSAADAERPRVAVVYSDYGEFRHRDDYDARLESMGWPATKFQNTQFGELVAGLDEFDIILGSALFNYSNAQDFSTHREALMRFVRQGGAMVLTDCNYPAHLNWLQGMGEGWAVTVRNTVENPTPMEWMDRDHAIFTTPNRIESVGGSWAHMQVGEAWTPLARSAEGGVTAAIRDEGRGYILLTSRWPHQEPMLENLWTYLQFRRAEIITSLPDLRSVKLGENRLTAEVRNLADRTQRVSIQIRDEAGAGAPVTIRAGLELPPNGRGDAQLVLNLKERGEHRLTAVVSADGATVAELAPVTVVIPPMLAVDVLRPRYRSSIYASRPPEEITLGLRVVPDPGVPLRELQVRVQPDLQGTDPITVSELREQEMEVSFALGQLPHGSIFVRTELRRAGEAIASEETGIRVIPQRPNQTVLDDSGLTLVDGEPFFPVGIYHVSRDDFARLPAMGLNTVVAWGSTLEGARQGLDAAEKAGLRVVLETSRFLRGELDLGGFEEVVRGVEEHPALLAWYSVDEPSGKQLEWCEAAYDLVVRTEPHHPIYLVMCSPPAFADFAPTTDILAVDPYPVPNSSIDMVANWMKLAQEAVRPGQPIWVIPQCHNWSAYRDPNAGRGPTPEEERCMVYQGIIYGAKGVIYYPWDDGPTGLVHAPELMAAVKQINGELREIGRELLTRERQLVADNDPAGLRAASFLGKGRSYLIATNTGQEPVQAALPLPGFLDAEVEVLFEGRTLRARDGQIRDEVAPLAVHVYRVEQP